MSQGELNRLHLYYVSRNGGGGYDNYDNFVCTAESEDDARDTHPDGRKVDWEQAKLQRFGGTWALKKEDVDVTYLGEPSPEYANEKQIICASFNAG